MEKKKGSRPTWAQVKELEGIIADLKSKYDTLLKYQSDGHDAIVEESAAMSKELTGLRNERDDLFQSNKLLETEVKSLQRDLKKEQEVSEGRLREIERLKNRSLWDIIFNRN